MIGGINAQFDTEFEYLEFEDCSYECIELWKMLQNNISSTQRSVFVVPCKVFITYYYFIILLKQRMKGMFNVCHGGRT